MWTLLRKLCNGDPSALASCVCLHNYCPLMLLGDKGTNITPADLKVCSMQIDILLVQYVALINYVSICVSLYNQIYSNRIEFKI